MSTPGLSLPLVEHILARLPHLTVGVLGDLFLDRYLDLDAALTEPSIETGLDAYQVVRVRAQPGAAGTVINNLAALGVGRICPIAVLGDDGEGYELRQALSRMPMVDLSFLFTYPDRRTPTYTKPMLHEQGRPARELNRLDIHNRSVLPSAAESRILDQLRGLWPRLDGLIVLDQVSLPDCGVVTQRVRAQLAQLGAADPARPVLADSRAQIGCFREVCLKPNKSEALAATGSSDLHDSLQRLVKEAQRPIFCTLSEQGILVVEPNTGATHTVPGYPVSGPIDPVGAGDSTSAGILCALASGTSLHQAAAFGNLIASITVQQLGTTGTATPTQVRDRFREVTKNLIESP